MKHNSNKEEPRKKRAISPLTHTELKELYRKSVHISSLALPLAYRFIFNYNKTLIITVLLPLAFIAIVFELVRLEHRTAKRVFYRIFGIMLRKHEIANLTGASFLLTASVFTIVLFPAEIAFISLSFLALGDTFAAVFGIRFGKRKYKKSYKSFEGSIACFVACFAYAIAFSVHPFLSFIAALAATFAESSRIPVDDNIKIPIITAVVMSIAQIAII